MNRIITLTTDFGTRDGFVAAMKGVILSINPDANIMDISHDIAPQNIQEGALTFAAAAKYFPANAIHVVVVDPGVGSARRALAAQAGETIFIAPDNGVLSLVIASEAKQSPTWSTEIASQKSLAMTMRMVQLTNPQFWLPRVSTTFHGRDIFAPVAAHLSLGVPLDAFGEPVDQLERLPLLWANQQPDGTITGTVIHVDRFGNLQTNIRAEMLQRVGTARLTVRIAGKQVRGLKQTYAEGARGKVIALINSAGLLEIAVREGNAARELEAGVGMPVVVEG